MEKVNNLRNNLAGDEWVRYVVMYKYSFATRGSEVEMELRNLNICSWGHRCNNCFHPFMVILVEVLNIFIAVDIIGSECCCYC